MNNRYDCSHPHHKERYPRSVIKTYDQPNNRKYADSGRRNEHMRPDLIVHEFTTFGSLDESLCASNETYSVFASCKQIKRERLVGPRRQHGLRSNCEPGKLKQAIQMAAECHRTKAPVHPIF